jgi:hypothetical protein
MQPMDPNRTFPARNDGTNGVSFLRGSVNYNDATIATGFQVGTLPQYAFILDVDIDVEVVFNAVTTNVLTFGTTLANANEIVNAADVSEAGVADTIVVRGRGRSLTASGDVAVYAKFTQTGTPATTGKAHFCITFALPNSSNVASP